MIDKYTGAMNEVNLKTDWSEPAREFPMLAQEAGLAAYARAWTMFGDPAYRQAADASMASSGILWLLLVAANTSRLARARANRRRPAAVCARDCAGGCGTACYNDETGVEGASELAESGARLGPGNELARRRLPHAEQDKGGPISPTM